MIRILSHEESTELQRVNRFKKEANIAWFEAHRSQIARGRVYNAGDWIDSPGHGMIADSSIPHGQPGRLMMSRMINGRLCRRLQPKQWVFIVTDLDRPREWGQDRKEFFMTTDIDEAVGKTKSENGAIMRPLQLHHFEDHPRFD